MPVATPTLGHETVFKSTQTIRDYFPTKVHVYNIANSSFITRMFLV